MPRKVRVISRELKLAAVHRMLAGENVSARALRAFGAARSSSFG
jgi:transposase-like protein